MDCSGFSFWGEQLAGKAFPCRGNWGSQGIRETGAKSSFRKGFASQQVRSARGLKGWESTRNGVVRETFERVDLPQALSIAARLSRAASIVASISASVCAAETNSASYCDGGRKIPRCSISWKNLPNRAVSDFLASE